MKRLCLISLLLFTLCSCQDKSQSKSKTLITNKTKDSIKLTPHSFSKTSLKVSAYLLYNDNTASNFDVLNDKTIALWNVVAGGGDAAKSSENTKISFVGTIDSMNIRIKNGKKFEIDTMIIHSDKNIDFIIRNTGCQQIYVSVLKKEKTIYNDTIPFHCGE